MFTPEDYARLNLLRENESDLLIDINDGTNKLQLKATKAIIVLHSEFLSAALRFGSKSNILELKPLDAFAAYDLILSFYGIYSNKGSYSKWKHMVALNVCRKNWFLDIVEEIVPIDSKIESTDYNYFLEYCEMTGFNTELINVAAKNMPLDYNLDTLSIELIQKMSENELCPIAISNNFVDKIYIQHMLNYEKMYALEHIGVHIIIISPDKRYIATVSLIEAKIWNAEGSEIACINCPPNTTFTEKAACVKFLHNTITIVYESYNILTYNFIEGLQISNQYLHDEEIQDMIYSPNGMHFVSTSYKKVKIWNIHDKSTYENVSAITMANYIDTLFFTPNNKYLIVGTSCINLKVMCLGTLHDSNFDTLEHILPTETILEASFVDTLYVVLKKSPKHIEVWDIDSDNTPI